MRSNFIADNLIFLILLTILFIILKLMNVLVWNWFLILSPLWGSYSLMLLTESIKAFIKNNLK